MSKISLDPSYLRTQAATYERACESILQSKADIDRTNADMAAHWDGNAYRAYIDQYQQLEVHINKYSELMQGITKQLRGYSEVIEARDIEDATKFGLN